MDLRQKEQMGIAFVTHDLAVVNEICEKINVMYAGRFVEVGGVQESFSRPVHPYTYSLLKSAPDMEHQVERLSRHLARTLTRAAGHTAALHKSRSASRKHVFFL